MIFCAILPLIPFMPSYSGPSAHPAVKSASVTNFLIHLYWSAAEPMPTGSLGLGWGKDSIIFLLVGTWFYCLVVSSNGCVSLLTSKWNL